ncbi:hypothetical protein [Paenibacillus tepidiphilus]|uniref:hypothetical protein n=1 Tax=Paenibacillus tepidiphilus TaxID=2608683 RepID=UPI00123850F6|nr:hypothetical protein [Paenibacillus tepidiphilus]
MLRKVMLKKAAAFLLVFGFILSSFNLLSAAAASATTTLTDSPAEVVVAYPDGTVIQKGNLTITRVGVPSTSYTAFAQNGIFSFNLPDGTYKVSSVSDYNTAQIIPFYTSFTVAAGSPQPYILQLPPKIEGSIITADGADVPHGRLYMTGTDGITTKSYVTQARNGKLTMYLPDGTYTAGYLDEWNSMWAVTLYSSFTVTGGQVEQPPLVITVPLQYTGTVTKSGAPLSSAVLYFQSTDDSSIIYEGRVRNGKLNVFLLNGNYQIYKVVDMTTSQEYNVNLNVTVANGVGPLTISIP